MIAVLTGDIINSRGERVNVWMAKLRAVLSFYGNEYRDWEIYRGDTFQLETEINNILLIAIHIKSYIKQFKALDVRLAIGIGEKDFQGSSVTSSNGSAFINSGQCFDGLKKRTMALKSNNEEFDTTFNLCLDLATLTMDNWPPITSKIVASAIENQHLSQIELSKVLHKSQSNISESLNRAGYETILKLVDHFNTKISNLKC